MKVSILNVLSLGVSGGVPEGDGDHGDNIRLKANMISFVVTVWSPLSPSGPPATPTHPDSKRVVGEWVVRGEDSYLPDSLSPWDTTRYTRDALGLPGERILKVTKKSGNRGRCRKLSL